MTQPCTVEETKANIAHLQHDRLARKRDTRRLYKEDHRVHAFIRLSLHDFERRHGVEATEKLRQQLVDLTRTELFPGDEIGEFGKGQLCILLRDRHQQHVLFVAQSLQYFLEGPSLQDREHNITVLVSFFNGEVDRRNLARFRKIQKKAAAVAQRSANRPQRVIVLSDDQDLTLRLHRSLSELQIDVMHVETSDQAHTLIEFGFSDITIVDINGAKSWPGLAFRRFDSKAEHHHIMILCGDADETSYYRQRSVHAVNILPIHAVDGTLFPSLVQEILTSQSGLDASLSELIGFTEQGVQQPSLPERNIAVEAAA